MARQRTWLGALLVACLPGLAGCSGEAAKFAEVEGTVTLNGKPLPDVEVVFLPDSTVGTLGPTASCYTDEQGRYRLWCERAKVRGALVGTHRVCVHDIAAIPVPLEAVPDPRDGPGGYRPRPPRVPVHYADVARTPFRDVVVQSRPQTLDFDVKAGRP